jgi:hypothetical protein
LKHWQAAEKVSDGAKAQAKTPTPQRRINRWRAMWSRPLACRFTFSASCQEAPQKSFYLKAPRVGSILLLAD